MTKINGNLNRKAEISTDDDVSNKRDESVLVEEVVVNEPGISLIISDYLRSRDMKITGASTFPIKKIVKIARNIFKEESEKQEKHRVFNQCQL